MLRTLCLAGTIFAFTPGPPTMAADQGRAAGPAGGATNGVIVGRVIDTSDQPVSGALVTLLRRQASRGVTRLAPVNVRLGSITNAKGEFRFERLALGPYYVVALPRNRPVTADHEANRFGYAITYYPGADRASNAKPVTVSASAPATADIALAWAHLAEVSGTVIGSDGQPAHGGRLAMTHGDGLFGIDSKAVPSGRMARSWCGASRPAPTSCNCVRARGRRRVMSSPGFRGQR